MKTPSGRFSYVESGCAGSHGMLGVAVLLNAWRLFRGPDATDRILALDTLYINAAAMILLYGV